MSGTPVRHTIYSARGRARMARVDLGQPGAPLPWAAPQLSPQSFTEATLHILGSISPEKRAALTFTICKRLPNRCQPK